MKGHIINIKSFNREWMIVKNWILCAIHFECSDSDGFHLLSPLSYLLLLYLNLCPLFGLTLHIISAIIQSWFSIKFDFFYENNARVNINLAQRFTQMTCNTPIAPFDKREYLMEHKLFVQDSVWLFCKIPVLI